MTYSSSETLRRHAGVFEGIVDDQIILMGLNNRYLRRRVERDLKRPVERNRHLGGAACGGGAAAVLTAAAAVPHHDHCSGPVLERRIGHGIEQRQAVGRGTF